MNVRVLFAVVVLFAGCVSTQSDSRFADGVARCAVPPDLPGEWSDRRMTQAGPASVRFALGCDCRYESRIAGLFGTIRESGEYRVENGAIVFSRSGSGVTKWPFALAEGRLVLTEAAGENREYSLTRSRPCTTASR